ncbi:MAG: hypothetical protein WDM86_03230 [Rhizomicrobium sp.]
MRALTREELELVAGGDGTTGSGPTETVTVTGTYDPYGGDGGGFDPGGDGGGGGGGNPGDPPPQNTFEGQHCAVNAIKDDIAQQSDHTSAEHLGIVYHDSTGYHTSPTFTGNGSQASLTSLFTWMTDNGVAFSEVTDFYHNHDQAQYGQDSATAEVNRYPSGTTALGGQDWNTADYFVAHGADASVFTMTVEDTNGVARDFAYSQESTYKGLSLGQLEAGHDLPTADAPCGG